MIFGNKKTAIDWLVVGLGNPGMAYDGTRHNAGYDALCVLAKDHGITLNKKQFKALVGTASPLLFIYVCGLTTRHLCPAITASPISALYLSFLISKFSSTAR